MIRALSPAALRLSILLTIILTMTSSIALHAEPDASAIQEGVNDTLNAMLTFSCSFKTEQYQKVIDRTRVMEGTIQLDAREAFKLRVERKGDLTVIDGTYIYSWLNRHKQVQISDFSTDGDQFPSPHTIFSRYANRRNSKLLGEEEINGRMCDILELVASKGDAEKVTVWVDRELTFPVKAQEIQPNGDSVLHVLTDVILNADLDESLFIFETPEGASVVDLRE